MNQYVKENRAESFSPVYKKYEQDLYPVFEIDNLLSQILSKEKVINFNKC